MRQVDMRAASILVLLWPTPALAQTGVGVDRSAPIAAGEAAPRDGINDDIVVTAQKRAENVQNVPISIAAFGGAQLTQSGITNTLELTRIVPNFTTTRQSNVADIRLNIRGVGATTATAVEPSVASFLDDVYVSRPGSLAGAFFDVESVEVLRGPQGTLFGRNASVGAISVHNKKPVDRFEADVSLQASSFDTYLGTAAFNTPLGDGAAIRIAGILGTTNGPWFSRITNKGFGGIDTAGIRGTLKLEPAVGLTWLLRADYLKLSGDGQSNSTVKTDTVTPTAAANMTARLGGIGPDYYNQFSRQNNNFQAGGLDDHQFGLTSDTSLQ